MGRATAGLVTAAAAVVAVTLSGQEQGQPQLRPFPERTFLRTGASILKWTHDGPSSLAPRHTRDGAADPGTPTPPVWSRPSPPDPRVAAGVSHALSAVGLVGRASRPWRH